ncbi:MAG TPA: protein kinase [Vicinamibacterales bacterium]|nr:protein kinase [Vicinamibacterales bacterium]
MRLSPGSSVGPYRILASLGAGGMGEVYRAEHVRLGREVAVKVLHELTSDNPEYKSRFEREARVLASLNHPNIATLHGLEEVGDSTLLEMELVPGETLAEKLEHGAMAADEALPIFKQIAHALDAAHERGIIHRDLKPSNVKVTPEGRVKVLDFGLAKAFENERPEASSNAAMFTTTTQRGLILGTAAYMSPEHVRGKSLDRRTDIWAFGCMLYEALTGKPPFASETVSDTLAAVLREEPEWRPLSHAPMAVQRLIKRCLKKDPTTRLHDIADAGLEIDDALSESAPLVVPMPGRGEPWRVSRRRAIVVTGASVAFAALTIALGVWLAGRTTMVAPTASARLAVPVPAGQHVERGGLAPLAISPDGKLLVYAAVEGEGRTQLFARPLDRFESTAIAGTDGASAPFFSPDGRWIAYYAGGALQRVSLEGGAPLKIADAPAVWSATWGSDDLIVFAASASPGGLWRVPAAGGVPERLTTVDGGAGEIQHAYPERLPNGDVLFGVFTDRGWHLASLSLGTKNVRALGQPGSGGAGARYITTGHLLYASGGGLVAVPFVPATGVTGSPVPLLERPEIDPSGSAAFAVSASGTLVYVPRASSIPVRSLVLVDRTGRTTLVSETRAAYSHPRISPDGRRLAVAIESDTGSDIWIYDLERGSRTRLTSGGLNRFPLWSADGTHITYQASRGASASIFSRNADGSGEATALINTPGDATGLSRSLAGLLPGTMPVFTSANPHLPMSWSTDGANLAFDERKPSAERDIWVLPKDGSPSPFLVTPFDEFAPAFSPDGKWLAYVSDESGRAEVYVQPFPGPGPKWPISTEGGTDPAWSSDGRELYFRRAGALFSVTVTPGTEFRSSRPVAVFDARYETIDGARNYDVVPRKSEFVAIRNEGTAEREQFNVVLNWLADLTARRTR